MANLVHLLRKSCPSCLSLLLLGLLLAACTAGQAAAPPTFVPPTPKPREVVQVVRRPAEEWVDARGYVASEREQELYFPIGGYVRSDDQSPADRVKSGDRVAAGAVLAEIDAWELETTLGQARLNLQIMELRHGAGSALSAVEEQIYQLQHAYQQYYVDGLQQRFDKTRLAAPFDGILQSLTIQPGKRVEPYEVVGLLISPDSLMVKALVPEAYRDSIAPGQTVSVTLHVDPDRAWPASVAAVAAATTAQAGGRYFEVTVAFDPGAAVPASYKMACTARILVDSGPEALFLPAAALTWEGTKAYVDLDPAGSRGRTEILVGSRSGDWVEITAGLQEGQTVYVPSK
jgi:RND family efflux transporter MFP subunit